MGLRCDMIPGMPFLKRYANALLSLVFIAATNGVMYLTNINIVLSRSILLFSLIPIMSVLGVFFAWKSKKCKEPSWASILMLIIGIVNLVIYLFVSLEVIAFYSCGYYSC